MNNAWKVIWFEGGVKKTKGPFEGNRPKESGAVDFAKRLIQKRGIPASQVHVVSKRKPFDKPDKVEVPNGWLWCPYCLKVRDFLEKAVRFKSGMVTPALFRCPICTVSIFDAAVKRNNVIMMARMDLRARTQVPSEKLIKRKAAAGR